MKRLAIKFGGTSVGSIEKIKKVASIIKKRHSEGNEIIVIVSAMSGETNQLIKKSNLISKNFDNKELDVLLSSGEQVTSSLLSGAILDLGLKARSWLGWQIPIITNDKHQSSQIKKIKTEEITKFISEGGVAVVAGFQGITAKGRITTLGRGGSDLSAVYWNKYFINKDIYNTNFKFVDLINYLTENIENIYLKCDGHWSPKGNYWAAKIISDFISKN